MKIRRPSLITSINTFVNGGLSQAKGGIKGFGDDGFDYAAATGYLALNAGKYFSFQFGHGKILLAMVTGLFYYPITPSIICF